MGATLNGNHDDIVGSSTSSSLSSSQVENLVLLGGDPQALDITSGCVVLFVALVISLTRLVLLDKNVDFAYATQRSNDQILKPLTPWWDWLWLSFLSGISEEALFRGALIPVLMTGGLQQILLPVIDNGSQDVSANASDWIGSIELSSVFISALIFGYFH